MRWNHAALVAPFLLILALPVVPASSGHLVFESRADVVLRASILAEADGGILFLHEPDATGRWILSGARGELVVWTERRVIATAPGPRDDLETLEAPIANAEDEHHEIAGSDLTFELDGREARMVVLVEGGRLVVAGRTADEGRPSALPSAEGHQIGLRASPFRTGEQLSWELPEGWVVLGPGSALAADPFPNLPEAAVDAAGAVTIEARAGTLAFVDAAGEPRRVPLGMRDAATPAGEATWTWIVFRGTLSGAVLPASGEDWVAAAPSFKLAIDGEARFARATGAGTVDGRHAEFEDAAVVARGRFDVRSQPVQDPVAPTTYEIAGEWDTIDIEGARYSLASPPAIASVAAATGFAALVALLFEGPRALVARLAGAAFFALYTRLSPSDLLDHPLRRRIHDEVSRTPGIHLRELNRRVGGGWGAFRVHLRLLRDAGYVRFTRHGKYATVHASAAPAAVSAADPVLPNPLTRATFAALPPDGAPLDLRDLRDRVGISRQLLNYHVRRLEVEGLAVIDGPPGRRWIARRPPAAAGNGAARSAASVVE